MFSNVTFSKVSWMNHEKVTFVINFCSKFSSELTFWKKKKSVSNEARRHTEIILKSQRPTKFTKYNDYEADIWEFLLLGNEPRRHIIYIYIYIHTYVYIYIYMYTQLWCIYICLYLYVCVYMYICMYVVYIHVSYVYVCIYICTYISYIYTYVCTHINMYIYTRKIFNRQRAPLAYRENSQKSPLYLIYYIKWL